MTKVVEPALNPQLVAQINEIFRDGVRDSVDHKVALAGEGKKLLDMVIDEIASLCFSWEYQLLISLDFDHPKPSCNQEQIRSSPQTL